MAAQNRARKAAIHAVVGATGSGKTSTVVAAIKKDKPGRLLIWDTKGEFAREGHAMAVHKLVDVYRIIKRAGARQKFAIAYQPRGDTKKLQRDFSEFCLLAFHAKNCWLIAEELSDTTLSGWSPEGWKRLVTQGRTEGVTVWGLSQSPALVDKTFFTNCSTVQTGRLNSKNHARVLSDVLAVPPEEIMALEDGAFIRITFSPRNIERGRLF